MKIRLLAAATAMATLSAGTALADCNEEMKQFSESYAQVENRGQIRSVIQDLRNAAAQLNQQGLDQQCMEVVATMQQVVDDFQDQQAQQVAAPEEGKTGDAQTAAGDGEAVRDEQALADRRKAIADRVLSLDEVGGPVNTADFIGTSIYNYNNEALGEVSGLLLADDQRATHLVMSHGGFWNIGEQRALVPIDLVKLDPESNSLYVDISREQIDGAPEFAMGREGEWSPENNDQYYQSLAKENQAQSQN